MTFGVKALTIRSAGVAARKAELFVFLSFFVLWRKKCEQVYLTKCGWVARPVISLKSSPVYRCWQC